MPLQRLKFTPGINRESTTLANESGWFECDKIRFRSGYPEKLGGWVQDGASSAGPTYPSSGVFLGIARSLCNWSTLNGQNLLGIGTSVKYYVEEGPSGYVYDITPIRAVENTVAAPASLSTAISVAAITVTITAHGAVSGDQVTVTGAAITAGIPAAEINGKHTIVVLTANTFSFATTTVASSNVAAGGGASTTVAFVSSFLAIPNAFTAATGSASINVTAVRSGALAGDYVTFSGATGLGGVVSAAILNTEFVIDAIVDPDNFTITVPVLATASDTAHGSVGIQAQFQQHVGSDYTVSSSGWGAGGWGSGSWGLTVGGATGGQEARLWSQGNYGENLILCPRYGPVYMWAPTSIAGSYTRAVRLSPDSPGIYQTDADGPLMANWITVSSESRFVLAFATNDYGSTTQDPLLVRWSDQEDYTTWTPSATNQAGSMRLSFGSELKCAMQMRQETLVFTDAAVYSMQFLGPPYVWGFTILDSNISITGPNAVAVANNVAYWMGNEKFYTYSGRVETLPCSIRQYVFGDINQTQGYQIFAGTNEGFNEIWWFYCSANSTEVDRYVIYNHLERLWMYGTLSRTAWLDSSLRPYPIATDYNGNIINHEYGVDDVSTGAVQPIESYIQSADFDIGDGHNYGFVWRMVPDVTFDGSNVTAPTVDFTVRSRRNPGSSYYANSSQAVASTNDYSAHSTYTVQRFTELVYVRARGRQLAFKIGSTGVGTQWQLGAPSIDVRPDGRR